VGQGDLEQRLANIVQEARGDDVSEGLFDESFDVRAGVKVAEIGDALDTVVTLDSNLDTVELHSSLASLDGAVERRLELLEFSMEVNDKLRLGRLGLDTDLYDEKAGSPGFRLRFESVLWEASTLLETTIRTAFDLHLKTCEAIAPVIPEIADGRLSINDALLRFRAQLDEDGLSRYLR
jgi:hypothetical protein